MHMDGKFVVLELLIRFSVATRMHMASKFQAQLNRRLPSPQQGNAGLLSAAPNLGQKQQFGSAAGGMASPPAPVQGSQVLFDPQSYATVLLVA